MSRLSILLLSSFLLVPSAFPLPAQDRSRIEPAVGNGYSAGPLVTATAGGDRVRIAALALARRIRLEVLSLDGEPVYDSGFRPGNRLEWQFADQHDVRLPDGFYGCLVSVEGLHGRTTYRRGIFQLKGGTASFHDSVNGGKPGAAAAGDEQEDLTILAGDAPSPFALLSHDGTEGWVESATGALNLSAGSLSRQPDGVPHLRLTPEGNVGIGVSEPRARLDVAGLIRASEGLQFSDGTILKMQDGLPVLITDSPVTGRGSASTDGKTGNRTTRVLTASGGTGPALSGNGTPGRVFGFEGIAPFWNTAYGDGAGGAWPFFEPPSFNSLFGANAGHSIVAGCCNSIFGAFAGQASTASRNSFFGYSAGNQNSTGADNAFFGNEAGLANTAGSYNSIFGARAGWSNNGGNNSFFGYLTGYTNNTGSSNSFFGREAGYSNTSGGENAFFGSATGYSNSTGSRNAFFGHAAGNKNSTGADNAFFGWASGYSNTTGNSNAFFGKDAGASNTSASSNSFFGDHAGYLSTSGGANAFFGSAAGYNNTNGFSNSFFGKSAGTANTVGYLNAFFGDHAGASNTTGGGNSFFGTNAGSTNTTENFNTFIGFLSSGAAGITSATALGYLARVNQSNSLVLGSINGVNGATADTKVGIGMTNPERRLHVAETATSAIRGVAFDQYSPDAFASVFILRKSRNAVPGGHTILLNGDALFNFTGQGSDGTKFVDVARIRMEIDGTPGVNDMPGRITFWTTPDNTASTTERMRIDSNGNVGIGTAAPAERLHVAGNIRYSGTLINAAPDEPVPDYVFEPDYSLLPLEELGRFVEREKHLPNVPSAAEVKEKGLNLGEFQMKLLEKIEELTLYTLDQARAIRQQQAAIESHRAIIRDHEAAQDRRDGELAALKSLNAALEARLTAVEQAMERAARLEGREQK